MGVPLKAAVASIVLGCVAAGPALAADVTVSLPATAGPPIDGRLILVVSPKDTPEPREQVELEAPLRTPFIFGKTLDGARPGASVTMDDGA